MFGFNIVLAVLWIVTNAADSSNWLCENGHCIRETSQSYREGYVSLELCRLLCSKYLNIWPQPTGTVHSTQETSFINSKNIVFYFNGPVNTMGHLNKFTHYFEEQLKKEEPFSCEDNLYDLKVYLTPINDDLSLDLHTDESYTIKMDYKGNDLYANITAPTVFGVRHGIETLLQLLIPINEDGTKCLVTVNNLVLTDKPKFHHRGLLIDTARNYLSINSIKKQLEGMAASKLNVLHWHVTDTQSFPLVSPRLPNMTRFGAYSTKKVYTPENVKDIIDFAETRGIRVLVEIDGPSHAGMGWQWGYSAGLGYLAICVNKQPWRSFCIQPPCGQLNPSNPKLYDVLTELYKDIVDVTPDRHMFHMGGDEVYIPCWNSTPEILKYLKGKPLTEETYLDLWSEFQQKNLAAFDKAIGHNKTFIVVWTSSLTDSKVIQKYLPKERYIIQTWIPESQNNLITELANLGYQIIISTKDKWYLDHGFWGTTEYHKWKSVYNNRMYDKYVKGILGGEVCMWGELVDDNNIDSKIWPRAAAAAERLWTYPSTDATSAQYRFFSQRERLIKRGISSEAVMPKWCVENEGECSTYL
ncbi:chitooligosaccharidolytic beta-N-acetylglucosaminidase-like isoform X2 [Diabrotica undecimpunctata]|uniref:chitooligosaccharidolytic beta-N-acetylglucosaminidase-like isoform X1 n=1 Tax=Diabrotica undecimpunctata TaxID=50387 RepID=UPI003B63E05E